LEINGETGTRPTKIHQSEYQTAAAQITLQSFIKSAIITQRNKSSATFVPSTNTLPSKMNGLIATLIAIVTFTSAPSSALLFSPLLLADSPWGVAKHHAGASSRSKAINVPAQISRVDGPSILPNFSQDDELMRCKHELLSSIYEKSLNRGFVGGRGN
jgi:hypothetical protein